MDSLILDFWRNESTKEEHGLELMYLSDEDILLEEHGGSFVAFGKAYKGGGDYWN